MRDSLNQLVELTKEYYDYLSEISDDTAQEKEEGKWSVNDQIIHLILSISPLNKALKLPKFQLKLMFGGAKRPVKSFDVINDEYRAIVDSGFKAPKSYVPKESKFKTNRELYDSWLNKTLEFDRLLNKWNQTDLDKIILPHPSMGKLTISELVHFTLVHTRMHLDKIKKP